jgi:hypothetical protein
MSKMPKAETQAEKETGNTEALASARRREDAIRAGVLAALGSPARLLKVAVLSLWGNNFRINVWTGEGAIADAIPNSYFVTTDDGGAILRSEPPIRKQY